MNPHSNGMADQALAMALARGGGFRSFRAIQNGRDDLPRFRRWE
jgi:hypothetical protein